MDKLILCGVIGAMLAAAAGAVEQGGVTKQSKKAMKLMHVGDSITHGFGTPSYRWALHKILVDQGVKFTVVGVTEGNHSNGLAPGTEYRGVPFNNRHSAMSSERAYEISGRNNNSPRLGKSNIFDWLLLDKTYGGDFKIASPKEMPDVFIILIGTNDTLSDWGRNGGIGAHIAEAQAGLIGGKGAKAKPDMDTIIGAIRKANRKATIYVLSIPTWSDRIHINNTAADFAVIRDYNKALEAWAKQNKVHYVDINEGMVDVSREDKPFAAIDTMFNAKDHLHPTLQGDLIMAGHVAEAAGWGGRTAGLPCQAVSGTSKTPLTVVLSDVKVGDGAENGWNPAEQVTLQFNARGTGGKLAISESALTWNGSVLYSKDFSKNKKDVRVAYVEGDSSRQLPGGFYVWLGDMLVGEALQGTPTTEKGGFTLNAGQIPVKAASSGKALAPEAKK